ncbi:MAG: PKD domain-containing protein [Myxococcaceae bacterium]|jgi:hypothetical protein|nr:PKD domain-containing protein [Myxococcaceae bacterium]
MLTMPPTHTIVVREPMQLSIAATNAPTTWAWSLEGPDGGLQPLTGASSERPSFTPTEPGTWRVSVTAGNDAGESSTSFPLVAVEGTVLPFEPSGVAHHRPTHRLALGRDTPPSLEVFDVRSGQARSVPLMRVPLSVAFDPNGEHLVVGEVGQVEVVSLTGPTPGVVATWPLPQNASAIALAVNSTLAYWASDMQLVGWVELSTGAGSTRLVNQTLDTVRLHPDPTRLYGVRSSFAEPVRFDLSLDGGALLTSGQSASPRFQSWCRSGWVARDGTQLLTGCGSLYRLSARATDDLLFGGQLPGGAYLGLDETTDAGAFVTINQALGGRSEDIGSPLLLRFLRSTLQQVGVQRLPSRLGALDGRLVGEHVFVDDTDTAHVLLVSGPGVPAARTVWVRMPAGVP